MPVKAKTAVKPDFLLGLLTNFIRFNYELSQIQKFSGSGIYIYIRIYIRSLDRL